MCSLLLLLLYLVAVDCQWNNFDDWTACSKTCGSGQQSRTRTIMTEADNGGAACTGATKETRECNTDSCTGK